MLHAAATVRVRSVRCSHSRSQRNPEAVSCRPVQKGTHPASTAFCPQAAIRTTLIIKLLVEIADEKRQDLLFKALLEQKQLTDSAVPVIEWMDPLHLKEAVDKDPKLRAKFTDEQLDPIANGDIPDGCTWHLTLKLERCNL